MELIRTDKKKNELNEIASKDIQNIFSVASLFNMDELEEITAQQEQVDCPVYHRFGPGVYIREVNIPAGTFVIGHRQRHPHLNILLKGKVVMLNNDDSTTELTAPLIFNGESGRKCGYIKEDMVWLNVYATNERNVEELEKQFLDKTPIVESYIEKTKRILDNDDYERMLGELNLDRQTIESQVANKEDRIDFPLGCHSVMVRESDIQGQGLFATAPFSPGDIIAPARINGKRTPAGVFTNHAVAPNAKMEKCGEDIILVAVKHINGQRGGFPGDEITTDYRETLKLHHGGATCQE